MTRWHHGHSILIGVLVGFLLSRELLWAVTAALVVGVLLGRGWASLDRLLRWAVHRGQAPGTYQAPRRIH